MGVVTPPEYSGRVIRIPYPLMLLGALLLLAGCGDNDAVVAEETQSVRAESFSACPCPLPIEVMLGGPMRLGAREYLVRADAQNYEIVSGGATPVQTVATTLTMPALALGDWYDGVGVLHVMGCRNTAQVLVTFGDSDDDGAIDDYIGEYTLPNEWQVTSGAAGVASGHVYLFDAEARAVIRLTDGNADRVPDGHAIFASHDEETSPIIEFVATMRKAPGGVLTLAPTRMASGTDLVTVIVDADGNGTPESVKTMLRATAVAAPARLLAEPQVGDVRAAASGIPGTTLELWEVNAQGDPMGRNPLGSVTLGSADTTGVITWTQGLAAGQFVRVYGSRSNTIPGPIHEVEPNYPRVSELSEPSIDGGVANVIAMTGKGFDASTQVKLIQTTPPLELTLVPTVQSATQLQVTIPILPAAWIGRVRLRAYNTSSPVSEIGGPLIVYR